MLILTLGLETETPSLPLRSPGDRGPVGGRALGLPGVCDPAGSGRGGASGAQQGPQSSSLSLFSEWQAWRRIGGGSGGLPPRGQGQGCGSAFLARDTGELLTGQRGRPPGGPIPSPRGTRGVGGRAAPRGSSPPAPGGTATSSPWDPQPLLSRTPATRLDLHVHRANVARLVLSDPQLPVLGGVHLSEQLVHRLDCLQGRENRGGCQRRRPGQGHIL